ncbi:unnamed protein product [Caenorhabditis brenneri]
MDNISINGNPDYINFKFNPYTVPAAAAVIPLFYILPTIFVLIEIIKVYFQSILGKREETINPHVFSVIVLQLVMSFFYMSTDYTTIRIPATGIITAWCASVQPNHLLKSLFLLSGYFNYTAMLFPFLLSVLRLIPVYYPTNLESFRLAESLVVNSIFWLSSCCIANILLYRKLKELQVTRESIKIKKAERSLTLITLSMFPAYMTNLAMLIVFIVSPTSSAYLLALRPYGSDCDFVIVPWVFYLTHPMFKRRKIVPADVQIVNNTNTTL